MTAAETTEGTVKKLVPKEGGRIATIENDVAKLRSDHEKLKRVVAQLMMSNPEVQARLQKMLIDQIDQQSDTEPN
jgi:hypothetical protein